jgi:tRNA threonylcarbamoyladenosine biosynthesis protein TsaB
MLLLVTDTSGKHGSIALARTGDCGGSNNVELIEAVPLAGGTFSAQLVPQIAALLARHGYGKPDIDGFVVVSGPGSFTGLRIGLAAVKGLGEILGKPIVALSLLELVALAVQEPGKVVAVLDAGREEVYAGEYEIAGDKAHLLRERLLTKEEFFVAARGSAVSTPDEKWAAIAREAELSVRATETPDAGAIARLGWRKMLAAETVAPDQLEANYIRRSDAEIFAKPGSS